MTSWRRGPRLGIFISYRRTEIGHAARLYDWLSQKYNDRHEHVFMDFEKIRGGRDWESALEENLAKCNVCVAVIGDRWLQEIQKRNADGENEQDFVRRELATAFQLKKLVIPFLIKPVVEPPLREQLPPSVAQLPTAQAIFADHARWDAAVEDLMEGFVDAPPVPGKATGQRIVDLFEAGDDPPNCLGRTKSAMEEDVRSGRWKTQEYPVQDGPPPNPNWMLVSDFVSKVLGTVEGDALAATTPDVRSRKQRMKGSQILELAEQGRAPKMMGRAGGLDGAAVSKDIADGRWRDQDYEVSDDTSDRRNWFATEDFLKRVQ